LKTRGIIYFKGEFELKKENYKSLFIIFIGVIFWIIYLGDSELSKYGIYTIINYSTHEVLSLIPLLSIFITSVWLLSLIIKIIKERNIKSHKFIFVLLIILFISQAMYISDKEQTNTTSFVTNIDKIDGNTIIIDTDEHEIKLYCPELVIGLLETDGTEYGITYEWNKKNPGFGKLTMVQSIY
jgi:hypothetical protein